MFVNSKIALRKVGIIEGWSFVILIFIAMPLKHLFGYPIATKVFGSIHGVLFIWFLYQLFVFYKDKEYDVSFKFILFAFISSLIPFGTFFLDKKIKQEFKNK